MTKVDEEKLLKGIEVAKGWSREGALAIYRGLKSAGIDFVTYVSDSWNLYVLHLVERDENITTVSVAREDEGMAIAMGAYLTGRRPAIFMEASGLGLSMLALSWLGLLQQMAVLIFSSHTGVLGEFAGDSHAVTRYLAASLDALNIPHITLMRRDEAELIIKGTLITAMAHRTPVAIFLPAHILREDVL